MHVKDKEIIEKWIIRENPKSIPCLKGIEYITLLSCASDVIEWSFLNAICAKNIYINNDKRMILCYDLDILRFLKEYSNHYDYIFLVSLEPLKRNHFKENISHMLLSEIDTEMKIKMIADYIYLFPDNNIDWSYFEVNKKVIEIIRKVKIIGIINKINNT